MPSQRPRHLRRFCVRGSSSGEQAEVISFRGTSEKLRAQSCLALPRVPLPIIAQGRKIYFPRCPKVGLPLDFLQLSQISGRAFGASERSFITYRPRAPAGVGRGRVTNCGGRLVGKAGRSSRPRNPAPQASS